MPTSVKDIIERNKFLNSQNSNWRAYWQDLADFILPRKAWITSIKTKGEQTKFNFLYSSVAIRALRTMAAGFHTNLTNPAARWFALETQDKELMKDKEVSIWFHDVEDKIFSTLRGSNFYNVMLEFYTNYGCFGTSVFSVFEDPKSKVRFRDQPMKSVNLEEDAQGRISALYITWRYTSKQAWDLWGTAAGKNVIDTHEDKPQTEFDFLHYVGPRHERDVSKEDSLNMPIQSLWIAIKGEEKISESGFEELPYMTGRFYKEENDAMGYAPAMDVLPDIRLINAQQRTVIRASMKQADPPLVMPTRGFVLPLNLNPAAMNYREPKTNKDDISALPVTSGKLPITLEIMKMTKEDIEQGFFVPLFRVLTDITKQLTIPEASKIVSESLTLLGPVIGRTTQEVLDPAIIRVFNILFRLGEFPPVPALIQESEFNPVYLGPLAKAQRASEVGEIESFLADVNAVASVLPEALDKIDADKTIDVIADMRSIDPNIIRSDEEIKIRRDQAAQQQQAIAAIQAGAAIAKGAKDGAQAEKAMAEAAA